MNRKIIKQKNKKQKGNVKENKKVSRRKKRKKR